MQPPAVRDLNSLIDMYTQAFQPQYQQIDSDITANENSGAAQQQGLEATKNTAFKQIGQTSQNKGMFFSGFTPEEQAQYTANTYLPALAQLQATIAGTRNSLLGKKADLSTQARTSAINAQEGDKKNLLDWQSAEAQRAFQAAEAEKQRQFEADQNAKNRSASAASSRAAGGPSLEIRKNSAGGWDVYEDGAKSKNYDLAGYAQATGKDLINLLQNGDAKDRQAAKWYNDNIRLGRGQGYALDRLMNYDRPTAFYLGGGYGS